MIHSSTLPEQSGKREHLREWAWDQPCDSGKGKVLLLAICEIMPSAARGLALTPEAITDLANLTHRPEDKILQLIDGLLRSAVLVRDGKPGKVNHVWPNYQSVPYPELVPVQKYRPGYVYLLLAHNKYKIGKTVSLEQRLAAISTANPDEVKLLGATSAPDCVAYEKHLHKHFASKWIRGEWFRLSGAEVKAILKAFGVKGNSPWYERSGHG